MGTREAIAEIGAAGGLAVLAHAPWTAANPAVLDRLIDWGLRGLEAHYQGWDDATVQVVAGSAAARGLLVTGGSDFHGDRGDYAAAQAFVHVPPEVGTALLATLEDRRS
jgi:predicted metal-dependent phosphoesterase TrpH